MPLYPRGRRPCGLALLLLISNSPPVAVSFSAGPSGGRMTSSPPNGGPRSLSPLPIPSSSSFSLFVHIETSGEGSASSPEVASEGGGGSIMLALSEKMRAENEAEIGRLKFELVDLRDAVERSERRGDEAERMVELLRKEGEVERATHKGVVDQMRAQYEKEREQFSDELRSLAEEAERTRRESREQLTQQASEAEETERELTSTISRLEMLLEGASGDASKLKDVMNAVRADNRETLRRQKEESRRTIDAIRSVTFQEKRELEKKTWDLETRLDRAEMELIHARKETARLRRNQAFLEEELREAEKSYALRVWELGGMVAELERENEALAREREESLEVLAREKEEFLEALAREKEESLERSESEARRKLRNVEQTLAIQVKDLRAEMKELEAQLAIKDLIIQEQQEEEEMSLREAAILTWKLARERTGLLQGEKKKKKNISWWL